MSIKTFCRIILCKSDVHIFQQDSVQVFRAVDVFRSALRCGNKCLMTFLDFLFVDSDLDGVSPESVDGVDKDNIPWNGLCAIGEHLLECGAVIVCP